MCVYIYLLVVIYTNFPSSKIFLASFYSKTLNTANWVLQLCPLTDRRVTIMLIRCLPLLQSSEFLAEKEKQKKVVSLYGQCENISF